MCLFSPSINRLDLKRSPISKRCLPLGSFLFVIFSEKPRFFRNLIINFFYPKNPADSISHRKYQNRGSDVFSSLTLNSGVKVFLMNKNKQEKDSCFFLILKTFQEKNNNHLQTRAKSPRPSIAISFALVVVSNSNCMRSLCNLEIVFANR